MRSESYYNAQHRKRIDQFARKVFDVYQKAVNTAIAMGMSVEYDQSKPFSFGDYPGLKTRVNTMLSDLYSGLISTINAGTSAEWDWSNQKNDDLVKSLFGENMPKALEDRFLGRNLDALKAFQGRKTEGLDLSGRVWNYTQQFKGELEMALDVGLTDGRSASQLSQDVRGYLNDPDKLFRRVRDKRGVLQLSKAAKNYNPGQGVYRSSYKNAMRLTRTEINMAYREADHARFQDLDFVVGFQVHRSNNPYLCDVCESLKGKYPKTFKFVGWHPQCRCYVTSILATREEMDRITEAILNGEDTSGFESVNSVSSVPKQFSDWIDKNNERLLRAKSTPYFIKDNFKKGNALKLTLDPKLPATVTRTREWAPEFGQLSERIAKDIGVTVTPVNLKSSRRILEKANNDYGGDIAKVKDMIRNTFITTTDTKYEEVLSGVKKSFNIVRLKQQTAASDPLGYSGTLIHIKSKEGVFAEIQVNTAQMIYGKEVQAEALLGKDLFNQIKAKSGLDPGLGHKYYEEFRVLDENSPEDLLKINKLKAESKRYYAKLRNINL